MAEELRFDWDGYTGLATVGRTHVDWRIVEIVSWDIADNTKPAGWCRINPDDPTDDEAETPEAADVVVTAYVKWDGCSHWGWTEQVHICGLCSAGRLTQMIDKVFEVTAQILPTWNADVAR